MENNFQKKVEKITHATYLVSHHLKDNEPLKWELRKEGLALLACARALGEDGGSSDVPTDIAIDAMSSCASSLISLLSLSYVSGLVSKNNASIVIGEIESLVKSFKESYKDHTAKAGFILSDEFFRTLDKGRSLSEQKPQINKQNKDENSISLPIRDKKDIRQDRILDLLKNQSDLTIKDFARVISDCSEKTIQRELTDLVEKGIVRKDGERRWSKYSLK